jgi:elongation factor Ts
VAEITAKMVQELREKTSAGMMDCKRALTEAGGDFAKAEEILRKKGLASAAKKAGRLASEGAVGSYIHMGGKMGPGEVNCETDCQHGGVPDPKKDVAMQIAATAPQYVRREDAAGDRREGADIARGTREEEAGGDGEKIAAARWRSSTRKSSSWSSPS